ncbi:hypothetical protein ACFYRD_27900 [Streptomyces hirsutus]|uniref:hypothetical protein n=1 Tax=Streptomyces hirsutus TaxID=35620 RepID=UPI0036A50B48
MSADTAAAKVADTVAVLEEAGRRHRAHRRYGTHHQGVTAWDCGQAVSVVATTLEQLRERGADMVPHSPAQIRPREAARQPRERRLQLDIAASDFSHPVHTRTTTTTSSGHEPLLEYYTVSYGVRRHPVTEPPQKIRLADHGDRC